MRRALVSFAIVVSLLAGAVRPLHAAPDPSFEGALNGLEVCEEAVCGAALFTGIFNGQIDSRRAVGLFVGAINHDPLPASPGGTANITRGLWKIQTVRQVLTGAVVAGVLTRNDNNTFTVMLTLETTFGESAIFLGTLDHRTFPPRISGAIFQ